MLKGMRLVPKRKVKVYYSLKYKYDSATETYVFEEGSCSDERRTGKMCFYIDIYGYKCRVTHPLSDKLPANSPQFCEEHQASSPQEKKG